MVRINEMPSDLVVRQIRGAPYDWVSASNENYRWTGTEELTEHVDKKISIPIFNIEDIVDIDGLRKEIGYER
jgi:hypothetical protein